MASRPNTFLTPEEYLEIERKAEFKSEYYQGEMFLMPRANARHAWIITNLVRELSQQLKSRPARVASNNLRLRASPGFYTYPDVMVFLDALQFDDDQKDTLLNPVVIIEVLSDSTRDYDRGRKFQLYRTLPSLREYLTVAQDTPHIEQWTRQQENSGLLSEFNDLSQSIQLASIDCVLPLAEVYDKVEWTA